MANLAKKALLERSVTVNRKDLIERLTSNKARHVETYREAIKGYKAAALEVLKEQGEVAKRDLEKNLKASLRQLEAFDPQKPHDFSGSFSDNFTLVRGITLNLPVPRSYEKEYNIAIDIARWETGETMELTFAEFNCFVRDEWDWTSDFRKMSQNYLG